MLSEFSRDLEAQNTKDAINEAKAEFKKNLELSDPELKTEHSKVVLDFMEALFTRLFGLEGCLEK